MHCNMPERENFFINLDFILRALEIECTDRCSLRALIRINGTSIDLGTRLDLNSLIKPPEVLEWEVQRHGMYTLIVTGPDVPSWDEPFEREYMHWQIVNIPGKNYTQGETLVTYVGSQFCCNPGTHRMVYTVWKQPQSKPMNFSEERHIDERTHYLRRACFNTRKFAKKYNMTLWAANFLIAECYIE
nr:PREDICTED: protein D2-like isoform X2 [Bemisia tabaci]